MFHGNAPFLHVMWVSSTGAVLSCHCPPRIALSPHFGSTRSHPCIAGTAFKDDNWSDASVIEHQDGTLEFRFDGQRSASHRDTVISAKMQKRLREKLSHAAASEHVQLQSSGGPSEVAILWKVRAKRNRIARARVTAALPSAADTDTLSEDPNLTNVASDAQFMADVTIPPNANGPARSSRVQESSVRPSARYMVAKRAVRKARRNWEAAQIAAKAIQKTDSTAASATLFDRQNLKQQWLDAKDELLAIREACWPQSKISSPDTGEEMATSIADTQDDERPVAGTMQQNQLETARSQKPRQWHDAELNQIEIQQGQNTHDAVTQAQGSSSERPPLLDTSLVSNEGTHILSLGEAAPSTAEEKHAETATAARKQETEPNELNVMLPEELQEISEQLQTSSEQESNSEMYQLADKEQRRMQLEVQKAEEARSALQGVLHEAHKIQRKLNVCIKTNKTAIQSLKVSRNDISSNRNADTQQVEQDDVNDESDEENFSDSEDNQEDSTTSKSHSSLWKAAGDENNKDMESIWRSDLGLSYEDVKHRAEMARRQRDLLSTAADQVAAASKDGGISLLAIASASAQPFADAQSDNQEATITEPSAHTTRLHSAASAMGLPWMWRVAVRAVSRMLLWCKQLWWMIPRPLRRWLMRPWHKTRQDDVHASPSISGMLQAVGPLATQDSARSAAVYKAGFDSLGQWCGPGLPLADVPNRRLEQLVDLPIRDASLFRAALTSPSALPPGQRITRDFQRLEYLGDAVLGLVVRQNLMDIFPYMMEGTLTRLHSAVINGQAVAAMGQHLGLQRYLVMNGFSMVSGGHTAPKILADCTEALFGAVYLDTGLQAAQRLVLRLVHETVRNPAEFFLPDPLVLLFRLCKERRLPKPRFSNRVNKQGAVQKWQTVGSIGAGIVVRGEAADTKQRAKLSAVQMCLDKLRETSEGSIADSSCSSVVS